MHSTNKHTFMLLCGLTVVMLSGAFMPAEAQEIRLVTTSQLEDVAKAWQELADFPLTISVEEELSAARMVGYGKADFALIQGPLEPVHKSLLAVLPARLPLAQTIGWEAIVLITSPAAPIEELSVAQARLVLAASGCVADTTTALSWRDIDARYPAQSIKRFVPLPETPSSQLLTETLLAGCALHEQAVPLSEDAVIERAVGDHGLAIGVVHRLRYLKSAQAIPLKKQPGDKAVRPDRKTVAQGQYPLARPLMIAMNQRYVKHQPQTKLLDLVNSPEGQNALLRLGYYPRRP